MSRGRSDALKTYWRQVHEVQRQHAVSVSDARATVALLRESGIRTAAATKRSEGNVAAAVAAVHAPYTSLDDWIDSFEDWDGDYEYYDIETGADY